MHELSRRDFAALAAAASTGLGLSAGVAAGSPGRRAASDAANSDLASTSGRLAADDHGDEHAGDRVGPPLEILILGGTGFLGPAIVDVALARGHTVTLFNRGRTNRDLYPELEQLRGDRDPQQGDGLSALEGRRWDAVVDTSGYVPRITRASAELLAPNVRHYVFISSVSVYADERAAGLTEDAALDTIDDPTVETVDGQTYGPLKALCESSVTEAMDGRATNIRPGFIVGPMDRAVQRFPLWLRRAATRDRLACPGAPDGILQLIDARDIGRFCLRAIERSLSGAYNLVGPKDTLTTSAMLDAIDRGIGRAPERTWIDESFIEARGLGGAFVPWLPTTSAAAGFLDVSHAKAIRDGLTFRPLVDTVRDTHAWLEAQPAAALERLNQLLESGAEDELLAAWDARSDG